MKKSILLLSVALFVSCDAIFVENISNQKVSIIAPVEGTELTSEEVKFNWNVVTDAEQYELQVATPNFKNAAQLVIDTLLIDDSLESTLSKGEYEWRIKAKNSEYETNYTTNSFIIN